MDLDLLLSIFIPFMRKIYKRMFLILSQVIPFSIPIVYSRKNKNVAEPTNLLIVLWWYDLFNLISLLLCNKPLTLHYQELLLLQNVFFLLEIGILLLGMLIWFLVVLSSLSIFWSSIHYYIEPQFCKEVSSDPNFQKAMIDELDVLHKTDTWDLVPFPFNKQVIVISGCKG